MAGRVLSEADASAQVELDSGKRVKVKTASMLLKFDQPAPAQLISAAQAVCQTIELDLAWEFSPEEEFGFADLARDYFSDKATLEQQAGMLYRLFEAPHYFRRAGKGRFRKAPADVIAQALSALEKKKLVQLQIERHPYRAAGPVAKHRRHNFSVPVPLAPFPVRQLSQRHGIPGAGGAGHQG